MAYTVAKFLHLSEQPPEAEPANPDDIEDGEITDDDDEEAPPEAAAQPEPNPATACAHPTIPVIRRHGGSVSDTDSIGASKEQGELGGREKSDDRERADEKDKFSDGRERGRHRDRKNKDINRGNSKEKGHRHMTEAEKSILHLRKKEKMLREREKWEKPWIKPEDDDFAKNIEKTLASILNKKEKEVAALSAGEDAVKDDEKRTKKRKKEGKDKRPKNKHRRMMDSPRSEIDENEMLNIRSGSPSGAEQKVQGHPPAGSYLPMEHQHHRRSRTPSRSDDSYNSELSSEEREERARRRMGKQQRKKKEKRQRRDRKRNHREDPTKALQDSQGVCVFYLQGKCQKNDCPYSHEVSPPMKLELCKFYLMECCAKGENCSYMHSEFPCKFYHTGLPCIAGKDCKFAHGKPLSDGLKQILFKHIETAPRDILQGFPRLSRDEALNLINQTQKKLNEQYGHTSTSTSTAADTNTTSSLSSTALTHSSSYGDQVDLYGGLGMYKDASNLPIVGTSSNEKEKDGGSKGTGIPSLFDITVPVPRQLDFDLKTGKRNKNSRWQQDENSSSMGYLNKNSYHYGADQDMRFSSNGDIDMRTLPAIPSSSIVQDNSLANSDCQSDLTQKDVDIRQFPQDTDIRIPNPFGRKIPPPLPMDVDNRNIIYDNMSKDQSQLTNEDGSGLGVELPQTTRDLIARINANQKNNAVDMTMSDLQNQQSHNVQPDYEEQNINWYSDDDDDDDNRLTIKVEEDDTNKREREDSISEKDVQEHYRTPSSAFSPPELNAQATDIVGKLGDLSKIDISVEVTKLLSSMSQNKSFSSSSGSAAITSKSEESLSPKGGSSPIGLPVDPRINKQAKVDSRPDPRLSDPRQRGRQNSIETREKEKKSDKMSIYEQGGMDMKKAALEIENEEVRGRPDIDLRNMSLPFKGMQNYTPATEIDASINSHPPMVWKVNEVEIPRPDYTGLKLSISDAEKTGDPRLRKIFRLSIDEKDSPASPKASPKHSSGVRIDPRLRKMEEKIDPKDSLTQGQMSYNQQVTMLQSSQFYQSLTSNQKLMLNQELARCDQSGGSGLHDPVLNTLLTTLNLLPSGGSANQPQPQMTASSPLGAAGAILANINKMNPLMNPNQALIGGPGLLGAAPGIPNINSNLGPPMNPDYPMNFDPRGAPGILGNPPAPFGQFGGMDQQGFGGYNDEYYGGFDEQHGNMMNQGGHQQGGNMGHPGPNFRQGGRGFNNNRDQRRRGNRDGNFRGGRGNHRHFNKRGGSRDKLDRNDRERRGNRGHSPQ
ncbi:protein suppressor of sable isoform X3 [Anthonomus grandis grandis]|uniref:protein suppressor of sable isoform X3 n=1 Tax=Anthonomus grandis grandis TaxID=2921223 RepID=UPI0021658A99|nr:protein suppressor of sable isoform X3 [Anthonomus grandis grandis]